MKRISILFLSLFLCILLTVFTFSSCSNSADSNNSKPSSSKQSTTQRPNTSTSTSTSSNTNNTNQPSSPAYTITSISSVHNGLARFKTSEGKYGYMDVNGNTVIEPIYESAPESFDTLALVEKSGKQHFINRSGNIVYSETGNEVDILMFSNGLFGVETKQSTISGDVHTISYYDEKGHLKFSLNNASQAYSYFADGGKMIPKTMSCFNEDGYAIINISDPKDYYHPVHKIIDKRGNFVNFNGLSNDYSIYEQFGNYAVLNSSLGDSIYIDYKNQTVIESDFDFFPLKNTYHENLSNDYIALYKNYSNFHNTGNAGGYGLKTCTAIIHQNKVLIDFQNVPEFGGAEVRTISHAEHNGKHYFTILLESKSNVLFHALMDADSNILISPTTNYNLSYSYKTGDILPKTIYVTYPFSAGLCKAQDTVTGLFGFVDLNGNWIIEPQYKNVTDFSEYNGEAYAVVDEETIINSKGKVVFTAKQTDS